MNIFDLPEEVIEGCILPFLPWNDLLRFRRVCKTIKEIADQYIRVHPNLVPEIEISDEGEDKSFGAFIQLDFPTTRIFLNNVKGSEIYRPQCELSQQDIVEFLGKFGPLVKHLRVKQASFHCLKEWIFMKALPNLQSLEADRLQAEVLNGHRHHRLCSCLKIALLQTSPDQYGVRMSSIPFPKLFETLKVVKIGQQPNERIINLIAPARSILESGKALEHVALPYDSSYEFEESERPPVPNDDFVEMLLHDQATYISFVILHDTILTRCQESPSSMALKLIDFVNYHSDQEKMRSDWHGSIPFLRLCVVCLEHGVKLANVDPSWFVRWGDFPGLDSPELGGPVVSLVNLNHVAFPLNMPNLERIEIRETSRCRVQDFWRLLGRRPNWPALRVLDINVDYVEGLAEQPWASGRVYSIQDVNYMYRFFFEDISRPALTELRLNFVGICAVEVVPDTEVILQACPNLKKITLVNWLGTNEALLKFWTGLLNLEEISLEYCKRISDLSFIGADFNNPVFLKLTKLKKLSLKGLDQMPELTDTLFERVISHLNLSHFTLTSDAPLISVTSTGILSLLDGSFAQSIAKFPFRDWSLDDVYPYEFKEIEKMFRSYKML